MFACTRDGKGVGNNGCMHDQIAGSALSCLLLFSSIEAYTAWFGSQSSKMDDQSNVCLVYGSRMPTILIVMRQAATAVVAQDSVPLGCWEPLAESMHCRTVSRLWLEHHEADTAALSPECQDPDSPL